MGQVKKFFRELVPHKAEKGYSRGKSGISQRISPRTCPPSGPKRQAAEEKWDKSKDFSADLSRKRQKKASRGEKVGQVKGFLRGLVPFKAEKGKPRRKSGASRRISPRTCPKGTAFRQSCVFFVIKRVIFDIFGFQKGFYVIKKILGVLVKNYEGVGTLPSPRKVL